jgi:hypothetical protein
MDGRRRHLCGSSGCGQSCLDAGRVFVITVLQVIGLGLVLKWKGDATPQAAATTALVLWFFIALPFCHYAYLYTPGHNATLLMIDASHLLVGWGVSAIVLRLIK